MAGPTLSWCPDEPTRCVYRGRIRAGAFGTLTDDTFEVWETVQHRMSFLHPFPIVNYSDDSYRVLVNGRSTIETYFALHAEQQSGYLNLFRDILTPGARVADCGCGGGALLDLVQSITQAPTVAIEPFAGFHASLESRGHRVFSSMEHAHTEGIGEPMDVALSIHVIEHVDDPVEHLRDLRQLVHPGGYAIVLTPNWDDFLRMADPQRFEPFFYRRVHNYYFTAQALRWIAARAGWRVQRDIHYQEYGLANALIWLRDGRPAGHAGQDLVDATVDDFWKKYLERCGRSNHVGVVLQAPASQGNG